MTGGALRPVDLLAREGGNLGLGFLGGKGEGKEKSAGVAEGVKSTKMPIWCNGVAAPASVAGLTFVAWQQPIACGGVAVRINEPGCVSKTYPDYFTQLAALSQVSP